MDEDFTLYDLVDKAHLKSWHEILTKEDEKGFGAEATEIEEKLRQSLNDEQLEMAKSYALAVKNRSEDIFIHLVKRALDMGVKIGMELKDAFDKIDNNTY